MKAKKQPKEKKHAPAPAPPQAPPEPLMPRPRGPRSEVARTDAGPTQPAYHIQLAHGVQGWVGSVAELPECVAEAATFEAAAALVHDIMQSQLAALVAAGGALPEPAPEPAASGKLLLRLPRSLHDRLIFEAKQDGVSLNQLLVGALSASVGWKLPASGPR